MEKSASLLTRLRIPIVLALLVIIGAVATFLWSQSGGPGPFSFELPDIQKVQADQDLRLVFPDEMNQESVEENLVVPDGVRGSVAWDQNTLVFRPVTELSSGEKYEFTVLRHARKQDGESLRTDLNFNFVVSGIPTLLSRIPAIDATQVPTDVQMTLIFDRPMVPLTQVQGQAAEAQFADWPVSISPAVEGRWRWLGTTTAVFDPEEELQLATRYTITVPAGISSAIGDQTAEDFSWSFETPRPLAQSIRSADGSDRYGPSSSVLVEFSLPIDLNSAEQYIKLDRIQYSDAPQVGEGSAEEPNEVAQKTFEPVLLNRLRYHQVEVDGSMETQENIIVLDPSSDLSFKESYQVAVLAGITSTDGNLGSLEDFTSTFNTAGDLSISYTDYSYFRIEVDFSNPIDGETLKENVSISPEPVSWEDEDKELPEWSDGTYMYLRPELEARTTYTLRFDTGLRDIYGQRLQEPYEYEFTTDPLPSRVFIHSEGDFGIFEKDKPPVYYLNAINVSEMQLDFSPLSLSDFLSIRDATNVEYEYQPDLSQYEGGKEVSITPPKSVSDEWEVVELNVEEEFGNLESGIYGLTLQAPEYRRSYGDQEPIIEQQYFALTNMALTLKHSGSKALVWLTDNQSGEAIEGARIRFHSLAGTIPIEGTTDSEGFFEADLPLDEFSTEYNSYNPEFFVTAEKEDDFTFLSSQWNSGMQPYNFGLPGDFIGASESDYRVQSYLYTDRPLYRAGDTVHFKGVVRLRDVLDGQMYGPKQSRTVNVTIEDARYDEVYNKNLDFTEFGSFSDSFTISQDASLGTYYMQIQVNGPDISSNYGSTNFSVLAYRKPEYQVEVSTPDQDYFDDQSIPFSIDGSYFFGAPLENSPVEWRVKSTDYFFNRYTDGYYSFALEDAWCWWNCERETEFISEGSGALDEQGHLEVEVPYDLDDKSLSQIVTLEADVFDPNNQVVSGRVSVPVHKADTYVGIRPRDYVVAPGEQASVELVTVNTDGSIKAGQQVTVKLYTREWNSIRKQGVDGRFYFENEPEDTFVRETSVRTNEEGKAIAELLVEEGGQHRVVAEVTDGQGRAAVADTSIYVYSSTFVNWPRGNHDRIEVVADKPEYSVGDTAQLIVKSPFQGENVKALVTVEREQILSREVITIESNAQAIELPITEDLIPNAYVSVVIVKPRQGETFNEHGLDTGVPAFRIGYSKLLVETSRKEVDVIINTDREKYGPRETVNVQIQTLDWQGNPIAAEVSLGVVDMSLLALTGFQLPDLVARFYHERGLGVNTAQTLLYLIERFKPGSKGGGGAGPEEQKRGNFKDTAFWDPSIVTDENGQASVSFELPDNLTTWQLLGIANSSSHTFGAKTKEIIETKDVIVRPVRPRFAVADDEVMLAAIVHNFLDAEKTFNVSLSGTGFSPMGEMNKTIRLAADSQGKLTFPVRIDYADSLTLTFKAETNGGVDEIEESIPVYTFGTPQTVATSGVTEEGLTEKVLVPSEEDAREGELSVEVSPTLASYLPEGLEHLTFFPYGCAEQVMSSFLPSVVLTGLQGFEAFAVVDEEELEDIVSQGLQKLYGYQRADGGFGYWQGSNRSYPYLSAYILFGMNKAREYGYAVDDDIIFRVRQYLDGALRSLSLEEKIDLATRAYILFVLSESGNVDVSLVNNLYEERQQLPIFAQSMLSMTLLDVGTAAANEKALSLLEDILETTKVDARGTHFEETESQGYYGALMHTNTRTTAFVLQNLVRADAEHPLIPRIVRYLLAVREQGHWDTTQSSTMSILALIEFLQSTGELDAEYTAAVLMNDEQLLEHQFNADNILTQELVSKSLDALAQGDFNEVKIGKNGSGRLYYDLVMSYFYLADVIPPAEEGIGIQRKYEPVRAAEEGQVTVGDTYKVTLTMTVPQDRNFVAVESPLPAGLEIIDLSFQTSQQELFEDTLNQPEEDGYYWWSNLWYFNHKEMRDDRMFMFADYLPTGVYEYEYLVRATTPGKFRHRPARIYEMYFPEVFGQSAGDWFTVESE